MAKIEIEFNEDGISKQDININGLKENLLTINILSQMLEQFTEQAITQNNIICQTLLEGKLSEESDYNDDIIMMRKLVNKLYNNEKVSDDE